MFPLIHAEFAEVAHIWISLLLNLSTPKGWKAELA